MSEFVAFAIAASNDRIDDDALLRRFEDLRDGSLFLQGDVLGGMPSGSSLREAADALTHVDNDWLNKVWAEVEAGSRRAVPGLSDDWSGQFTGNLDNTHQVAIAYIFD